VAESGAGAHPKQSAKTTAKVKPVAKSAKPALATAGAVPAPAQAAAPAPAAGGPFGFVQTTVSSITTGAAKLLDWGKPEPGAQP
jgi:hypothetical protein